MMLQARGRGESRTATASSWAGHGLFTWGNTQRESYLNTITIIDQIGQFIETACRRRRASRRSAARSTRRVRTALPLRCRSFRAFAER